MCFTYPLLSDKGSKTITAYGIHHKEGLLHPGTFLIDTEGVVRAKLFQDGYRKRHPNDKLIEAALSLP